jgi:hypothetical protein
MKTRVRRFEYARDLRGAEQRWCAAAEVDRVNFAHSLRGVVERRHLRRHGANVTLGQWAVVCSCGEVAIRATRTTERNVDVDSGSTHQKNVDYSTTARMSSALESSRRKSAYLSNVCALPGFNGISRIFNHNCNT